MDKEKINTEAQAANKALDAFYADTRLTVMDMMPELVAYSLLWHAMGYKNDPGTEVQTSKAHMLTLPFVFDIRNRLREANRWPEERNMENAALLTSILMIKAAQLPPEKLAKMRDAVTNAVFATSVFRNDV